MRILPAAAGAVVVTVLALGAWAGGANEPDDFPATEPTVSTPGNAPDHARSGKPPKPEKADKAEKPDKAEDRGEGKARGHEKGRPPHARERGRSQLVPPPPGLLKRDGACFGHARYEGGQLEPCPTKPHPQGKLVPLGPRDYSETEE